MTGTTGVESLWNTDQDQYNNIIMGIKKKIITELYDNQDVIECYWSLRTLWVELDAKFEKERDELEISMNEIEGERQAYQAGKTDSTKLWNLEEQFYRKLCQLMKKHGIYFREGEDSRLAAYKR